MYDTIERLIKIPAPSGNVSKILQWFINKCHKYDIPYTQTLYGTLIIGTSEVRKLRNRLVLAAHADEVGFQVTRMIDEGIYSVMPVGAVTPQDLMNQRVVVLKDGESIEGFVTYGGGIREKNIEDFDEMLLFVDTSMDLVGCFGTYARAYFEDKKYIYACAVDNRVALALAWELYITLKLYKEGVLLAVTVDEELEDHSADGLAYLFRDSIFLVLDYCPIVLRAKENERLPGLKEKDLPVVMYRGGDSILFERLRQIFDNISKEHRFFKGFADRRTIHRLETSNYEAGGYNVAVNICIPALGYHGALYRVSKRAIENYWELLKRVVSLLKNF